MTRWTNKECRERDLVPELPARQRPKCPACKRRMMVKRGAKAEVFWSCRAFPECRGRRPIDQERFAAFQRQRAA